GALAGGATYRSPPTGVRAMRGRAPLVLAVAHLALVEIAQLPATERVEADELPFPAVGTRESQAIDDYGTADPDVPGPALEVNPGLHCLQAERLVVGTRVRQAA